VFYSSITVKFFYCCNLTFDNVFAIFHYSVSFEVYTLLKNTTLYYCKTIDNYRLTICRWGISEAVSMLDSGLSDGSRLGNDSQLSRQNIPGMGCIGAWKIEG